VLMTGPADIEGVLVRGRREYEVSSLFRRREARKHAKTCEKGSDHCPKDALHKKLKNNPMQSTKSGPFTKN